MSKLIEAKHASKLFQKQYAFKDVSFSVEQGEFVVIVGPNGSGKTTLMKSLLSLIEIEEGSIEINASKIGYLAQSTDMADRYFPATVREVIEMGLCESKNFFKGHKHDDYFDELVKLLNIKESVHKRIGLLSGGQQQRALLARALIQKPEVLILDEPTSALDPTMRTTFYELMQTINQELGTTILLISHDIVTSAEYAKRVIYLDGTIQFDGAFREFCEHSELSPYIHNHELGGHHHDHH